MKRQIASFFLVSALAVLAFGCSEDKPEIPNPNDPTADVSTCIGCHSNEAVLTAVADPLPPPPVGEGGCGGTLEPLTAAQRVFVGGTAGAEFLKSAHGKMNCVACHGGKEPAADKNEAHGSKDFVHFPSLDAAKNCGTCHPSISSHNATNLHVQGWGQKKRISLRGNYPDYDHFPDQLKAGYDKNCGKCHSSCGQCHVTRPNQAGGGFLAAHKFQKTPDMRLNCTACHSARVGHAYFGDAAPAVKPDVHYPRHCTFCHKSDEMHGDGNVYTVRYSVPKLPQCIDCHGDKSKANNYHQMHWDTISCQGCHAQDYNNCGSCHVDTGARIGPYLGYKLGMNPLPNIKSSKYVVLRQTVAAPDTWSNYGLPAYPNFNVEPTFKLATPHSNQRWTARTKVEPGQSCFEACHIKNGKNKEVFLFNSDFTQPWEAAANKSVVVDGKLPSGWN